MKIKQLSHHLFATSGLICSLALTSLATGEEKKAEFETSRGFSLHSIESAPEPSKEVLEWYKENFKLVPNVSAVMAESPALLRSYWQLQGNLKKLGTLTPAEDNIVQTSIAFENKCSYCVAGHTMIGKNFFQASDEELAALRTGKDLPTEKAEALKAFTVAIYEKQGRVSEEELQAFIDAGYTRAQALDVVGSIAAKVMTNFTNQLALTPIDPAFEKLTEGLPFAEKRELVKKK